MGIGWAKTPDIEWYDPHQCPACGKQTWLEGIVTRRMIVLLVVPLPLPMWRDWYVRCRSCRTIWKVDKAAWKERAKTASKPEDVYRQQQAVAEARRTALPSHLLSQAKKFERKGWTFGSNTDETVSMWRESKGMLMQWLRITVDRDGRVVKEDKWTE